MTICYIILECQDICYVTGTYGGAITALCDFVNFVFL